MSDQQKVMMQQSSEDDDSITDDEFRDLIKKAYTDVFLTVYHLYKYTHERFHEIESRNKAILENFDKFHSDIKILADAVVASAKNFSSSSSGRTHWDKKTVLMTALIGSGLGTFVGFLLGMIIFFFIRA